MNNTRIDLAKVKLPNGMSRYVRSFKIVFYEPTTGKETTVGTMRRGEKAEFWYVPQIGVEMGTVEGFTWTRYRDLYERFGNIAPCLHPDYFAPLI